MWPLSAENGCLGARARARALKLWLKVWLKRENMAKREEKAGEKWLKK